MKFTELEDIDIALLSDSSNLNADLAIKYGVTHITISRWRSKLGVSVKPGRKTKESGGVYKKKGEHRPCPVCGTPVYYTPKDIKLDKRKRCSFECLNKDPVYIEKQSNVDRSHIGGDGWASWLCRDDLPEYKKYRGLVDRLTEKVYASNIDIINPNRHPRTICGVDGGWQLDHIKPVRECFDEGISVEEASGISNLRMLPWLDNLMRNYE